MAVSSGAGPHLAWVSVNGALFPLEHGSAEQTATRKSATFSGDVPLSYPGAEATFATLGANTASVIVSTRGVSAPLVSGEIDTADIDYVDRVIKFSGRDQSAMLHAVKSSEKWTNLPGSQIVQQLAGRVGLGAQVDPSLLLAGKQVQIDYAKMTDGISYAAVIHKLAEFDGARWYVKNGTLIYQALANAAGIYTLNYVPPNSGSPMAADFLNLRVRRNIQAGKSINVTVKSWNPKQKQVFQDQSNVQGSGSSQNYVYHIPNLLQDHVTQHAKAKANEAARHELTLDAELVGDPSIDVAMDLVLSGTGFFDQAYQMDSIHHEFGMGGHRMTITAKSAKSGRQAS
jgi:hypothetical protein